MSKLTHLDDIGQAHMVDISGKTPSVREALAQGRILMSTHALNAIADGSAKKGDVLAIARIAGIMAAKNTSSLIPLCHPLMLSKISVDFGFEDAELAGTDATRAAICATATARLTGQTGVEMEALTAVSVALLTIYDMAKSMDKTMEIGGIRLLAKSGGKSGDWRVPG